MKDFRNYLQHEFAKRMDKNSSYSLRAFAGHLKINHATLSSILSGKRSLTPKTATKLAVALNLSPGQIQDLLEPRSTKESSPESDYHVLQQDTFAAMSEWYFDAILELTLIPRFKLEPSVIAASLGISSVQAKMALETLERLNLISKMKNGRYQLMHPNSDNCLDADYTSAANRKYQLSILNKSVEALETIDRKHRDHTSTTLAVDAKDLPRVKEIIQKFRRDVDAYVHRPGAKLNSVYQLQVSFFPLSKLEK
jgi:uncharacterized protein (TIGR02147 family)